MKTFDNITLVPRIISEVEHRSECDTSIECFGIKLDIPLVATPMVDICNGLMSYKLAESGALGIVHRFQSIEQQTKEYNIQQFTGNRDFNGELFENKANIACAIGVTGDYQERFEKLYNVGCRIFCFDTANGMNVNVKKAVKWIRDFQLQYKQFTSSEQLAPVDTMGQQIYLIAGNVATREGYRFLTNLGVDCVRVGIAGGNVCSTRNTTGVYMPTLESIKECVFERVNIAIERMTKHKLNRREEIKKLPLIIADGGIRNASDFIKCLAVGADLVMCGRIFAGYEESPGDVIKIEDKLYKLYRGSSSHGVQQEYTQEKPSYNEGNETMVHYHDKSVSTVIKRYKAGLQSAMTYMNSKTLSEFQSNVSIEEL